MANREQILALLRSKILEHNREKVTLSHMLSFKFWGYLSYHSPAPMEAV